jgi:hypothetical protein
MARLRDFLFDISPKYEHQLRMLSYRLFPKSWVPELKRQIDVITQMGKALAGSMNRTADAMRAFNQAFSK